MSDIVDMASGIEAETLASRLARISPDIPAGVAGECDDCGEQMPRLVAGRCGYCRDGRTPPPSFYDRPVPVATPSAPIEETPMQSPSRKITIEGDALAAIEQRASANDISFKQAAEDLILATAAAAPTPATPAPLGGGVLSIADTDELIDELRARFALAYAQADLSRDLDEMTTRAVAAETKLAAMKAALLG